MKPTCHIPVLPQQVLHWLAPQPGQVLVDGTLGGGGHTRLLADAVGEVGRVIALDRDPAAIAAAAQSLAGLPITLVESNFSDLPEVLRQLEIDHVDGVLLDLGMSSNQLANDERGFSFSSSGPLDLRFNPREGEPAWRLVNKLHEQPLADLIYAYGEERHSRRIARAIIDERRQRPIMTASHLADVIRGAVRRPPRRPPLGRGERIDPATRTFQALRIAVNDELRALEIALRRVPDCLRAGGRFVVISFHSLEDRRVKEAFRSDERLDVLTRKPVTSSEAEIQQNPRARSAKLRAAQRK